MAPQAPCLAGLYVQPVVLSLQDMMAYISSHFPAVGDHLCFCLCSRLTFPLTPVFICGISLLQKSEIVVQSICLLQSQELHILQVFTVLWHVSLNLSPRRTSSHFQSNDGLWDVFLLNTTAHHAVLWWPSGVEGSILVPPPPAHKHLGSHHFFERWSCSVSCRISSDTFQPWGWTSKWRLRNRTFTFSYYSYQCWY